MASGTQKPRRSNTDRTNDTFQARSRRQCQAYCQTGRRCRNRAHIDPGFCRLHWEFYNNVLASIPDKSWDDTQPDYTLHGDKNYDVTMARRCYQRGIVPSVETRDGRGRGIPIYDASRNQRKCMNCDVDNYAYPVIQHTNRGGRVTATCPTGYEWNGDHDATDAGDKGVYGCCIATDKVTTRLALKRTLGVYSSSGGFLAASLALKQSRVDFMLDLKDYRRMVNNPWAMRLFKGKLITEKKLKQVGDYLARKYKGIEKDLKRFWEGVKYRTGTGVTALFIELVLVGLEEELFDKIELGVVGHAGDDDKDDKEEDDEDDVPVPSAPDLAPQMSLMVAQASVPDMTSGKSADKLDAVLAYQTYLAQRESPAALAAAKIARETVRRARQVDNDDTLDADLEVVEPSKLDNLKNRIGRAGNAVANRAKRIRRALRKRGMDPKPLAQQLGASKETKRQIRKGLKNTKLLYRALVKTPLIAMILQPTLIDVIDGMCTKIQNLAWNKRLGKAMGDGKLIEDEQGRKIKRVPLSAEEVEDVIENYVDENYRELIVYFVFWLDKELASHTLLDQITQRLFNSTLADSAGGLKDILISTVPGSGVLVSLIKIYNKHMISIILAGLVKAIRDALMQFAQTLIFSKNRDAHESMKTWFITCLGDTVRMRGVAHTAAGVDTLDQGIFDFGLDRRQLRNRRFTDDLMELSTVKTAV